MDLKFWWEAFVSATYLLNRLPTPVVEKKLSPFEVLYGRKPDYKFFRVFGCACFPYLQRYKNISWPLRHLSACFWVIVPFIRVTSAYIFLDVYMLPRVLFLMKIHSLTSPCLFQTTHFQHLFLQKILELQLLCFLLCLQRQSWLILQSVLLLLQIFLLLYSQINKLIKHF